MSQKVEGARKICTDCKNNGINIEIHCVKVSDSFGERLTWKNPDNSSHFYYNEETEMFEHTPTVMTPLEVWQSEMEERLSRIERQMGLVWGE